ncbi:hypothetical protein ACEZCY_18930 [Streptacidiphilus sp. N1-12]|uniref:Uncharacterized protein n=2 Tax=Streptacidiphilus alkalitolerans TaxID=3342712 RepID=A0ABV6VBJ4_9ACTN
MEPEPYCATDLPSVPAVATAEPGVPVADCVLCGEPTEHPATVSGATLCPRCEWQQAQRGACSG